MILSKIRRNPSAFLHFNSFSTSFKPSSPCVNSYNASKLLSKHFKAGRMQEAEKLFGQIPQRNVVLWSVVIHGYSINGHHMKSMESYLHMRNSRLFPNSFTVVGLLVGIQDLQLGQSIHGLILKCGLDFDLVVCTAMLNAYAKCGNITDSYKLFEGLQNPGLVSCNAMIAGFVNNELFEEAVLLFKKLRKCGLVPNVATALSIIQGGVGLGLRNICKLIHGLIVKFGLGSDIRVNNSVLDMYSCLMDLDAATTIFDGMELKDVISWTTMIGLLVNLEYATAALELFCKMKDSGVSYDAIVFMNLVSACAILGDLRKGKQTHAQAVVCGFVSELPLVNSIMAMYSKCGDVDSSRILFDQSTQKSLVSWAAIVSGYVQNGFSREALNLFIKFRLEEYYLPDSVMLMGALTASSDMADFELCQQLHCCAFEAGFFSYRSVQNTLISAYSKCGNMKLAYLVLKEMGYLKDVVSWNAIINGYGINGQGETALALYHEMREGMEDADSATYLSILNACSHAGLINDGLMIFNKMVEDHKIRPSQEHYGCIIDLLARAGCLSDASGIVSQIGIGPNAWRALLSGCMLHGNVEVAEFAARKVLKLEPRESDEVVLLSNVYASVGRFQDAEALRLDMQKKALIKNPGVSLLCRIPYDGG
ncbi:PREDICTED: pentatricopeptide repeat-containing protein At1g11290, chloroplastic [Theobroma cacao]|uniref:Pentatricopeptide repeat-containing protein At1g11290, chloroplastic n=1 Tax=Theobroma cacao TaxID=3641 RepID=A0AB32VVJ3_THECC|nr:PREDICTED: pentatricopeptide repeat-containing protein At1g11290, chloroplastic [Theobroma cacao]